MESYSVNNYMIRSRSEHIRQSVASLNAAVRPAQKSGHAVPRRSVVGAAIRLSLSRLMARSGKVLIEAGSSLQERSVGIKDPGPPRHGRAA